MTTATIRTAAIGTFVAIAMLAPLGPGVPGRGGHGVALADAPTACSDANLQGAYAGLASGFSLTVLL